MNNFWVKALSLMIVLPAFFSLTLVQAQINSTGETDGRVNTVYTSIPFLRINPDARTGGMGDVGLAISPDPAAIYWNASKLAFTENQLGLSLTYTPWLRELVDDIYIAHLSSYYKLDDLQTIAASIRYFSLGLIQFTDINAEPVGEFNPRELAVDVAYARKLGDKVSLGLTLKYIYSNLAAGQSANGDIITAANAVAGDLSFYYTNDMEFGGRDANLSFGAALTNVGNKVSYTDTDKKDFIPINLGIGSAFTMYFDDYNKLTFAFDVNKLMVPTPDPEDTEGTFRDKAVISGMLGSFGDAPGGFSEEIKELMYSFGLEYWYNNQFSVRLGHYNEHKLKGNRKYLTVGLGLKYNVFGLNFSYIVPTSNQRNPLDNTLRFSLVFNFNGEEAANF